ncbi:MAG: hypothetical protein OIF50_16730 [Flavobacteriaceae bacterium]|nr:hypothetical protein [Flavobacteriaceae bacterium]
MKQVQLLPIHLGLQYKNEAFLGLQKQKARIYASCLAIEIKYDDKLSLL